MLTLTGIDFGPQGGSVRINDKPAQIVSWNDNAITIANPDQANIKSGNTASAKIFLNDDPATPAVEIASCAVS